MQSNYGPNSVDEPSLRYKLQRKIKVFNTNSTLSNRGYNLVACSSKYGLVFIGSPDGVLNVYHLKDIVDKDCEPQHITVQLKEPPTHIAVNCDQELLAVTGLQLISVYNIANFQHVNPIPLDIRCDVNPTTFVSGLQWNPIIADNLAMVFYDGTLLVAHIGAGPQLKKVQSKARCLCWSPKGKQLVTGNSDGTLTQYKPDLTLAKTIPAPRLLEGGVPIEALAVYWISTFMFAVVYKNAMDNSRPYVTIINTPKATTPQCLNYEDICYSMGSNRPWYYFLQGIPQWSVIMASSSNSMEIATLGSKEGEVWVQWCQNDDARPELPLTDKKIENFPIGISIDICAIHQLPWGENSVLPHMPLLHVLSHNGLLTTFNVINLNKDAPQVCVAPQQLTLPAAAMTSAIPGEAPVKAQPVIAPTPIPPAVQTAPVQLAPHIQPVMPPPQYSVNQTYAPVQSQSEQKQTEKIKPIPLVQPAPMPSLAQVQAPQPAVLTAQATQQTQERAAFKAEQERINEIKVNQELKNMLIKEVNDFQMELYKFMVKTRETQAKLQRDIDSINANFNMNSLDSAQLKRECSLDDLRGSIIELKLELVRVCAVIAEARTHTETKDQHQWTQADPLTTKRVASVKKLAYYVQNQVEQAQKALDHRWSEAMDRDLQHDKPGERMIRPILDDVYQPLVKQQEILSRQRAVLRTLRNTLNECDVMPVFKSKSLLRSTPFKTKDPLSKLTKNILNMSIEPEKPKEPLLSSQKLDALRDMLSNHKTVKIKPVNVEMRHHLANLKMNYENSLKEKAQLAVNSQAEVKSAQPQPQPVLVPKIEVKTEPKQDVKPSPITIPRFVPLAGVTSTIPALSNVARTLFTDEKPETRQPIQVPQPTQSKPVHSAFTQQYSPITPITPTAASPTIPANTRSVLKDLLQNKQNTIEAKANDTKNDAKTFMGQPICSPSSLALSPTTTAPTASSVSTAPRTTSFTAKPISDITNMFNKFQPQSFVPETKPSIPQVPKATILESKPQPQAFIQETKTQSPIQEPKLQASTTLSPKSSETGEPVATETKTFTLKPKNDKPITNLFGLKPSPTIPKSNVPDVLKITPDVKSESKTLLKPVEKENVPEKLENSGTQSISMDENKEPQATKTEATPEIIAKVDPVSAPIATAPSETKSVAEVEAVKATEKPVTAPSNASSIFAVGNATVPVDLTATPSASFKNDLENSLTPPSESTSTSSKFSVISSTSSSSAASIFGAAVASQTTTASQASSIFASAIPSSPSTTSSVFGLSTQSSVFKSPQTSVFGSITPTTTATKPSVFSTPTPAGEAGATSSSVFGSTVTTSQPGSFFSSSVFATSTTAHSTTSVFGTTSTQAAVFGATITTPSVFSSTPKTTSASIFSSATSTPSAFTPMTTQSSIFGASAATTTSSSIFGTPGGSVFAGAGAGSNQTSVFGVPAATTQASSLFSATTATTQASVFGTPSTPTSQPSVFGATTQVSVFGNSSPKSVFGSPPATSEQSSSLFGGGEANLFAAASISTTSAPAQASGGNIFGGSSSGSVFGGNIFGSKTTFGQNNQTAASIFGGEGASSFRQNPSTNFWSGGASTSEGGFGSTGGGFGQQSTSQASSIFGGSTGGSFTASSPSGQPFGTPQQGGFGTPQQHQTGAGSTFGGSPTFGSTATFGSSTGGFGSSFGGFNKSPGSGFGAPAAFGGSATFGGGNASPNKMFGGTAPAPSFAAAQSNATFESLANQSTLTFGNLAQRSAPTQQHTPAFNTSPSFTGWRG